MMISTKLSIFAALLLILNVQADMIGWNRLRNNAAKHHCKRIANFSKSNLVAQYQIFFSQNGNNANEHDSVKTRRLLMAFRNQKN